MVTGTLIDGELNVDDDVVVEPGGRSARVRALQTFNHAVDSIGPGNRVAINLAGVEHGDLTRGDAVVLPSRWKPTRVFDAELQTLGALGHEVSRRGAYTVSIGSGEHPAQLRVIGRDAIAPGATGFVRIRVPLALPLLPGDRFVLRESGRAETVGGGEIVEIAPVRPVSKAHPDRSIERIVAERGPILPADLEALTGERRAATFGRWLVAPERVAEIRDSVAQAVADAGPLGLDISTLDELHREALRTLDDVVIDGGRARAAAAGRSACRPSLPHCASRRAPFAPPAAEGVDRGELRELVRRGLVVERDGVWFASDAVDQAARVAARLLAQYPEGITLSQLREELGTSRKYAVPLASRARCARGHAAPGRPPHRGTPSPRRRDGLGRDGPGRK